MPTTLSVASQPYEVTFSRNPVKFRFKVTPYDDSDAAVNTVISATLYCENGHYSNQFQEVKSVQLRPDEEGFAYWDVQTLLDAQLSFYVPVVGSIDIQAAKSQGARYYVRYSLANDYEQLQAPANTDYLNVIKGGLAYESLYTRNFFEDKIIGQKKPLRFEYDGEEAGPDEPVYIYWLDPIGWDGTITMNAYLSIRALPSHAVPSLVRSTAAGIGGGKWQVWCMAIGYGQQNLASLLPAANTADYFYLQVARSTSPGPTFLVQVVSMKLNYRNFYKTRTLHYHNSLGGMDTQVMRGQIDISGNYDKQTVTLLDTDAFAEGRVLKAVNSNQDARETSALKGETGWIPEARANRLRDLLNSNSAWEIVSGRLKPVSVATKTAKILSNNDKLISVGMDWNGTFGDSNFTPDDYLAQGTICPAMDFFEVSQRKTRQPHVAWHIPEGYEQVEVRWDSAGAVPASSATNTIMLSGSKGESDIDTTTSFPLAGTTNSTMSIYMFARVICDNNPTTFSAGPWKTVHFTLNTYPPPIARSDYFTTYQGTNQRTLGSVLANDVRWLNAPTRFDFPSGGTTCIGTAGGTFTKVGSLFQSQLAYTPPYSNFSGVDTCPYRVSELAVFFPATYGPPSAYGNIYVNVTGGNQQVISITGLPYIKLVQHDPAELNAGGIFDAGTTTGMTVNFYKDPLGQMPMDMTGLNLTFTLNVAETTGGVTTTTSQIYTINSGSSMELTNSNSAIASPDGRWWTHALHIGHSLLTPYNLDFAYAIAASNVYVVL